MTPQDMSVNTTIRSVLPKGAVYRISRERAGLDGMHILRVITPAWKTLPVYKRVLKVTKALDDALPLNKRAKIFRVSVLTSDEFKKLRAFSKSPRRIRPIRAKRMTAKVNGMAA